MSLSRLSLNSLWLLLSRLGTQLGMALFTILLARSLGSSGFGEYAFIASVIVIGNVLTTFGTDMLLIREIALTDDIGQLAPALLIQLLLSALFIGAILISSPLLPSEDPAAASALRIYSLSMLPLAFYTVFTTALRGRQRMLSYSLLNVALMVMQVLTALWLHWRGGGLIALAQLLLLVQTGAAFLAGMICARQFTDLKRIWRFPIPEMLPMLGRSAPIALLGLLGIFYQRCSLLLLPILAGAAVTGWFSAGARLIEAAKIGHVAVFTALYPVMAQSRDAGGLHWSRNFRVPGLVLLAGALLAALALSLLAGPLVSVLYGTQYLSSIPLVRILAWMLIPYALNSFLTLAFLARGEERAVISALLLSTIMLVLLTLWWLPQAGASGAAWASLCAEVAQSLILVLTDFRRVRVIHAIVRAGETAA
jgi:O-antigen/teichoic acid export membrane protein